MQEHLRMDGIKVFPEDAKLLQLVMQEHQIKNKSEAWRIVLRKYEKNRNLTDSFDELKDELVSVRNEISQLSSVIEDLYFIVQSISMGQSS
ncbi:hypothetical protein [Propionivibrio sp.]|uniref:hypothetical protein n=1 Tax=Propionivibrio sp. TaxID=2212460 RepID=UPI00262153FF|nr:hypothetical protein [Propionivibrio sp.]